MLCNKCGNAIPEGADFCPSCGTPVASPDAAAGNAPAASSPEVGAAAGFDPTQPIAQPQPIPTYAQPQPQPQPGPQGAYVPQQPQPGMPQGKKPWYETTAARIGFIVAGVVLIISGILKIAGVFDKSSAGGDDKPAISQPKTDDIDGKPESTPKDDGKKDETTTKDDEKKDETTSKDDGKKDETTSKDDGKKDETTSKDDEKFDTWAEECLDSNGDPTVYAITELKGWQLETLLQQQGYEWSDDYTLWVIEGSDGTVSSVGAFDDNSELMDDEAIGKLGKGGNGDTVIYRIMTDRYTDVEDAYKNLVSKVMVSEGFTKVDQDGMPAAFGVAYGPSMQEFLVELVWQEDDELMYVFVIPDSALEAGMFDALVGDGTTKYGDTATEVYANLTGKKLDADQ